MFIYLVTSKQPFSLEYLLHACQVCLCLIKKQWHLSKRVRHVFKYSILLPLSHFLQFSSVQVLSSVQLSATPWTAAHQAFLSITNCQSLLKLISIVSVMQSNYLILCHPLLLPPSIFPSIRVFSNESVLHIMRPKYWSFSFSISPDPDALPPPE